MFNKLRVMKIKDQSFNIRVIINFHTNGYTNKLLESIIKSKVSYEQDYFIKEMRNIINNVYLRDFELFNYKMIN